MTQVKVVRFYIQLESIGLLLLSEIIKRHLLSEHDYEIASQGQLVFGYLTDEDQLSTMI